ncbi:ABC transporter permease [Kineococcus sp. LSe6-4]|uniref:Transport permease protein n=1 Tax=Kineococcus halophytocola TaxID=3234027 RepID=A0ABV4H548_9ACTN
MSELTTTAPLTARGGPRPGARRRRIAALSAAAAKDAVRNRFALFFNFAFPLVVLLAFEFIYSGQHLPNGQPYSDYVAPGILAYGMANGAIFGVGYTLVQWRASRLLLLLKLTPTSRLEVLLSRYLVALAVSLAQTVVSVAVVSLPPFGFHLSVRWWAAVPVVAAGTAAFFALGCLVSSVAKTPDVVGGIANAALVPMAFFSGVFFPLPAVVGWIHGVSTVLPLRYLSEGLSATLAGTGSWHSVLVCTAVLTGFAVVLLGLAAKALRWR